ncbi:SDR family oxidoreductase [Streptomyces sp. NBC_01707]|uniref:SDR family oxidoreductase n=1 Tax=unclassified Streptomyces TaxID=2593676 RepID=UPI000891645F|nr:MULTISPECIES: SDR family oxidoreductase [unclassified Streptomyces]MDX3770636.1 SDR family oxidoreductase [Streptomyces sp. AK08-01B]MDX3819110.1 SDR family oxidoreductase [Streptomyces sp. AK08-01A]SCY15738.1 NAD(P)-dependent dehydrogenase, short-chain alcohol dehydrogenase family [Streptomyces sp. 136MFCol5.1]
MAGSLQGETVVVVGRGSGIARAIVDAAMAEGAHVVAAGRNREALEAAYKNTTVSVKSVDVTDETSIAALADQVSSVDHVVSTVSARARGTVGELSPEAILLSFHTKVVGPIMLAKHFAPKMPRTGSFVLFSGVAALEPDPGFLAVAATNASVNVVIRSLAVELAPLRVNAISPGTIDTGAWEGLGKEKDAFFENKSATNPVRRIGTAEDIAQAVVFAMTNTFMTGVSLAIDGGQPLV